MSCLTGWTFVKFSNLKLEFLYLIAGLYVRGEKKLFGNYGTAQSLDTLRYRELESPSRLEMPFISLVDLNTTLPLIASTVDL